MGALLLIPLLLIRFGLLGLGDKEGEASDSCGAGGATLLHARTLS